MLSGFNTNFRYRGVVFHVQTEDSGLDNPHVITHLFHGGNIMASEKRDYSELLAESAGVELEDAVRKLMEGLHKSMLRRLSRGEHDPAIEQRMGSDVFRVVGVAESAGQRSVTDEELPPAPVIDPPAPTRAEATVIETQAPDPERTQPLSRLSRVFGDRVVSEKPLDEVVLDYLVENARNKRKRSAK
jgi:hypothetical protein